MIDTHSHLLAQVDDGARDELEMLRMCRLARGDGITSIVATPHSLNGTSLATPGKIRTLITNLAERLASSDIDIDVLPGMEVRVSADLLQRLELHQILSLNDGKYLLLEFHYADIPTGFENLVRNLVEFGFRAILAHPEKNLAIQAAPEYVYKLLKLFKPWDLLVQITADGLSGAAGLPASRIAKMLLRNNLVHLIATDAHSPEIRPPILSEAVKNAARIVGEDSSLKMVQDIPRAILTGSPFPEYWPPQNPRRWWRIL